MFGWFLNTPLMLVFLNMMVKALWDLVSDGLQHGLDIQKGDLETMSDNLSH